MSKEVTPINHERWKGAYAYKEVVTRGGRYVRMFLMTSNNFFHLISFSDIILHHFIFLWSKLMRSGPWAKQKSHGPRKSIKLDQRNLHMFGPLVLSKHLFKFVLYLQQEEPYDVVLLFLRLTSTTWWSWEALYSKTQWTCKTSNERRRAKDCMLQELGRLH